MLQTKVDFTSKLGKIQSAFTKAIAESKKLDEEINAEISKKDEAVKKIQEEKAAIESVKIQNSKFIENLTKLFQ